MIRRHTHLDEQTLAETLKTEALRHTPHHSQVLHARIMQRIDSLSPRRDRSEATTRISSLPAHEARRTPFRHWIPLAAAAAILLCLWLWSSQFRKPAASPPTPPAIARDARPTIPAVDEICQQVAAKAYDRLEAQLKERQLAYLDDDARRLAHFVLDCTTPLPSPKR